MRLGGRAVGKLGFLNIWILKLNLKRRGHTQWVSFTVVSQSLFWQPQVCPLGGINRLSGFFFFNWQNFPCRFHVWRHRPHARWGSWSWAHPWYCPVPRGWGPLWPWPGPALSYQRGTAVLLSAKDFFSGWFFCLGLKNCGLCKACWPKKGASLLSLLYVVYFIKSGDSLHSDSLWVHGSSQDRWKWFGQGRNKHSVNVTTWLSLTNSKISAFENIVL